MSTDAKLFSLVIAIFLVACSIDDAGDCEYVVTLAYVDPTHATLDIDLSKKIVKNEYQSNDRSVCTDMGEIIVEFNGRDVCTIDDTTKRCSSIAVELCKAECSHGVIIGYYVHEREGDEW